MRFKRRLIFDYETRSEADLKRVGAVEYAKHPSTEIICLGFKLDNKKWLWFPGDPTFPKPIEFLKACKDPSVQLVAHNAGFERAISEHVLPRYFPEFELPPLSRWKCTAAKAAAVALPRNLEGAALALGLPIKKNMDGRRLMLKHSKPRPAWFFKGEGKKYFEDEFERWDIHEYCLTDVDVEDLLDKALPDLTPYEQNIWEKNIRANERGVYVDVETATMALSLIDEAEILSKDRAIEICGHPVTKRQKILDWVQSRGVNLDALNKGAIQDCLLNQKLEKEVKELLELRLGGSKTSVKKYLAMVERAGTDNRVRDISLYHGASTGRESGTGLQLQNLPKPTISDTNLAIKWLREVYDDPDIDTAGFLEDVFGPTMNVLSSCIRGMIMATPGKRIFMADYNAIEARVLAWVCDQDDLLEAFRTGADPYRRMAAKIFGIDEKDVTKDQRQLGKVVVLGCGYGMGADRFFQTCLDWGVEGVTPELASHAVSIYRKTNRRIVSAWYNLEKAAILATQKNVTVKVNKIKWFKKDGFLWAELPSGRRLAYHKPRVKMQVGFGGRMIPKLYCYGVNPLTKQYGEQGLWHGAIIENLIQAISRDITMQGICNVEDAGYEYLFQVHDEVASENEKGSDKEYEKLLTRVPPWAKGLPIAAEAESGLRYKK